uniref:Uncharacterized protein n=1 Tax=Arundo donax TaxID=35708 RepID=A0A0A9C9H4_ARUDO
MWCRTCACVATASWRGSMLGTVPTLACYYSGEAALSFVIR